MNEKTAREMFEKEGYILKSGTSDIVYESGDCKIIFCKCIKSYMAILDIFERGPMSIDMAELKAITKQCKELGW